jgi:AcrR family transcriptional regulator
MTEFLEDDVYWWRALDDNEPDTRGKILQAAYREIHRHGFQSASLSAILARTGVTKGALYYHFPNKTELGYAVIEEVISERINLSFVEPLKRHGNPIDGLIELISASGEAFSMTDIQLGCPLTALAQEMAPIDEGFRTRLIKIYAQWHDAIVECFRRAKDANLLRDDVDPTTAAATVVAAMEGALNAAKVAQDMTKLYLCGAGLIQYLKLIRKSDREA